MISIDSLRPDHLSSYGYTRPTSPNLDRLAAAGQRYTEARAASPWTLPSHMTMMTGLWPTEHQVIEDDLSVAPDVPMLAEAIRSAGYATGGFVSTIYVSGSYGFSRGFDAWDDFGITERDNLDHPVRAEQLVDRALAWVRSVPEGKPVFLFLHLYDVHYPYLPPGAFNERFDEAGTQADVAYRKYDHYLKHPVPDARMTHLVAQYDESIAYTDARLGVLFDEWSARPAYTMVLADHGEEFGERGSWGHGHTLYAEALRIPLILSGPGIPSAVRDERVGTIDVARTLAAIAGLSWTGDGVDVRGPVTPRPFWAETSRFDSNRLSLLEGSFRLDQDIAHNRRTIYDVGNDPAEAQPLGARGGVEAVRMEGALLARLGLPWTLDAGSLTVDHGAILQPGVRPAALLTVPPTPVPPTPGPLAAAGASAPADGAVRFLLWPPDAKLTHSDGRSIHGVLDAPELGPVRYAGPRRMRSLVLSSETRAQLEALGYQQGNEE